MVLYFSVPMTPPTDTSKKKKTKKATKSKENPKNKQQHINHCIRCSSLVMSENESTWSIHFNHIFGVLINNIKLITTTKSSVLIFIKKVINSLFGVLHTKSFPSKPNTLHTIDTVPYILYTSTCVYTLYQTSSFITNRSAVIEERLEFFSKSTH